MSVKASGWWRVLFPAICICIGGAGYRAVRGGELSDLSFTHAIGAVTVIAAVASLGYHAFREAKGKATPQERLTATFMPAGMLLLGASQLVPLSGVRVGLSFLALLVFLLHHFVKSAANNVQ